MTKIWLGVAVGVAGLSAAAAPLRANQRSALQPPARNSNSAI